MASTDTIPHLPSRIVLRRGQIWLSELAGILFVSVIIIAVTVLGALALFNESRIHSNNRTLARLETERILLSDTLEQLREQEQIQATLTEFARGRLPRQSIKVLVDLVYNNSRTFGYDPLLVLAVIHIESVFDPVALGRYRDGNYSGALGLMQLKFETAREVARDLGITLERAEDVLIAEINVALGVAYLTRLIAKFKSLKLGILAYNQGPGVVYQSIAGKRPLSQSYYNKVLKSYYRLKRMQRKNNEDQT